MKCTLAILLLSLSQLSGETFGWKSNPKHKKGLTQFVHEPGYRVSQIKPVTDLTSQLPKVYDQEDIGSCVANAGLAAFEFRWKYQHNRFMDGSRLGLYQDCLRFDGNFPRDYGTYTSTVVNVLKARGVGSERIWPYDTRNLPKQYPRTYGASASHYRVIAAYDVDGSDGVSVRVALSRGFPVLFGAYVYRGIQTLPASGILPMPSAGERPIGGHEMLIVGHNDNQKLYLVRNSWGVTYGKAGHLFIPYAYIHNKRICEDFATIEVTK